MDWSSRNRIRIKKDPPVIEIADREFTLEECGGEDIDFQSILNLDGVETRPLRCHLPPEN